MWDWFLYRISSRSWRCQCKSTIYNDDKFCWTWRKEKYHLHWRILSHLSKWTYQTWTNIFQICYITYIYMRGESLQLTRSVKMWSLTWPCRSQSGILDNCGPSLHPLYRWTYSCVPPDISRSCNLDLCCSFYQWCISYTERVSLKKWTLC